MTDFRGIPMRMRLLAALTPLLASSAFAQSITVQTVAVGDVGNAADTTGYGAVNYQYAIGKYEVTNAQYAAFLNAKAATDPYGLYNPNMAGPPAGSPYGWGILRSGSSGSYSYSVQSGHENWAVSVVSFWSAARFANWMHNGQGSGDTETGSYTITPTGIANNSLNRTAGATWVIASESEWYKAAYYKGGGLNAGYWMYGTATDAITTAMANYGNSVFSVTPVGTYAFTSAYGAYDMAGNVAEWTEGITDGIGRNIRGGSWLGATGFGLRADTRTGYGPTSETDNLGFRLVLVPGPSAIAVLALGSLLSRGRRRDTTA